jgi:tyrosinase
MYLRQFEKIICQLIDQPQWRLPYWDYTSGTLEMPEEFLNPANKKNPLWAQRDSSGVSTDDVGPDAQHPIWVADAFASANSIDFGSTSITTPENHAQGGHNGALERMHNLVHGDVGGTMADPRTAAADPIFWLHHANIDRIWEMWLKVPRNHANPTDPTWLNTHWEFPDPAGRATLYVRDVLDTRNLDYVYDEIDPPQLPDQTVQVRENIDLLRPELRDLTFEARHEPELIGASRGEVSLDADATHEISAQPPHRWRLSDLEGVRALPDDFDIATVPIELTEGRRVLLKLDTVTGTNAAVSVFGIYIDLPEGETPEAHPELKAGAFSTFGVESATEHGGGISEIFDITSIARRLEADGRWRRGNINVTFHPQVARRAPSAHDLKAARLALLVE